MLSLFFEDGTIVSTALRIVKKLDILMTMNKSRSMVNASGGHVCDLVIQICLESHSLLKLTNYLWKLSGWVMADLELDQIVDVHQLVTDNCQVC